MSDYEDIYQYLRDDHAGTHKSTAGSHAGWDKVELDRYIDAVHKNGYVVIEGVFSRDDCDAMREALGPLLSATGRNTFEGRRTQRLYSVIEKTFALNALVEHPLVLSLMDRVLEPNYLLSQLQAINILPGEDAQLLHFDDGFYNWPRPRRALSAAVIVPLTPFSADNGATRVLPGSHRWDAHVPTEEEQEALLPAVMAPGSVLFFLGTVWHGGGANNTNEDRLCVTAQYCAPWCRPQENYSLSVSRERAKQCSEHVQRLLGYSIHPPFMGFVDGVHPKRLLED